MVIGRGGSEKEKYREILEKKLGKPVRIDIVEVRQPDLSAQLVAENVASQLERRISFRRAMKMAIRNTMRMGAKGIKIKCSGRLGGAEIARSEHYHEGTIPLQTLRADIDYGFAEANTTYGKIGIKVWRSAPRAVSLMLCPTRRAQANRSCPTGTNLTSCGKE